MIDETTSEIDPLCARLDQAEAKVQRLEATLDDEFQRLGAAIDEVALSAHREITLRDTRILEADAEVNRLKKALAQIAGYREMAHEMASAGVASTLAVDLCWIARKVLDAEE